jgi:hypothetical protein
MGRLSWLSIAFVAWLVVSVALMAMARAKDCSAGGVTLSDSDWDSYCAPAIASLSSLECFYRVRLDREWLTVPKKAVVPETDRPAQAVVWPYKDSHGKTQVSCFVPGAAH